jgi:hypothetical protein
MVSNSAAFTVTIVGSNGANRCDGFRVMAHRDKSAVCRGLSWATIDSLYSTGTLVP